MPFMIVTMVDTVRIPKPLVKMFGLHAAYVYGELLYQIEPFEFTPLPDKRWADELGLSVYKLRAVRTKLESLGLIETQLKKVDGSPTLHYRLLDEEVPNSIYAVYEYDEVREEENHDY